MIQIFQKKRRKQKFMEVEAKITREIMTQEVNVIMTKIKRIIIKTLTIEIKIKKIIKKEEAEIEMKNMMVKDLKSKIKTEDLIKMRIHGILKVNSNLKIRIQLAVGEAEEAKEMMIEEVEEVEEEVKEELNLATEKDNIVTISKRIPKMQVKPIVTIQLNLQISMLMLIITLITNKKMTQIIVEALEVAVEIKIVKEVENVEDKAKDKDKAKVAAVEVVEVVVVKEVVVAEEEEEILQEIHIIKEMQQLERLEID